MMRRVAVVLLPVGAMWACVIGEAKSAVRPMVELTIEVTASDTVELVDSHGRRDGYRNGGRVAEIPGCGRGDSGETSGSDEDTIIVSHEPSDEKSIMFE